MYTFCYNIINLELKKKIIDKEGEMKNVTLFWKHKENNFLFIPV